MLLWLLGCFAVLLLLLLFRPGKRFPGIPGAGLQLPLIGHYQVRCVSLIGSQEERKSSLIGDSDACPSLVTLGRSKAASLQDQVLASYWFPGTINICPSLVSKVSKALINFRFSLVGILLLFLEMTRSGASLPVVPWGRSTADIF